MHTINVLEGKLWASTLHCTAIAIIASPPVLLAHGGQALHKCDTCYNCGY